MRLETDEELYVRINVAYGMWGAFLGHASECHGSALDECAESIGLKREMVPEPKPVEYERVARRYEKL